MGTSTEGEKTTARGFESEEKRLKTPPIASTESTDSRELDRAFVYLAAQNQTNLDSNVNLKALRRKVDWHIIPVMTACYALQFVDKVLINYSGVMGIREELHLVGNDFSNASSVFYISYLIAMVPNVYILQKVTVTKWLNILAVLWGIATACTAATSNYNSLLATRIFAGLFESPVSACLMLISSQWYNSQEQASRYSLWFCGMGVAQVAGAFISYGFQHVHSTTGLSSWRIMYLVLGLLTSLVGVVGYIILPSSPMSAKFLTDSEKVALLNHISTNQTGIENRHFKWRQLKEAALDAQIWLLLLMAVSITCSSGVISSYSSTVIVNLGYSSPQAALLSSPSGLVNIIATVIAGFSIRFGANRWAWIAALCVPGMVGGALMSFAPHSMPVAIIIGTNLVSAIAPTLMLTFQWAMSNCVGQTKRVVASAVVSGGFAIGSIMGPQTFQDRDKPEYRPAKISILATQGGVAFFALLLFAYYSWANQRKDRVEAALGPRSDNGDGRQVWGSKTDKENLSTVVEGHFACAHQKVISCSTMETAKEPLPSYAELLAKRLGRPPPETKKLDLPKPSKEFLAQKDGSRGTFLLHDFYGCSVTLLPDDTVVKSGEKVYLEEKEALDLAAELKIPAPRAYEASAAQDGAVSIRMDYIEGESLQDLWPDMSEEDRQDICKQLREIITTMQSAESKTGVIGSCGGGIFRECRRMGEYTGGPFEDEAAFNNYTTKLIGTTPTDINRALHSQLRTDHRIVFSHGDLSQHNIIIKDMKIAGLIDWEFSGYAPEYWEYVKFFEVQAKHKDWREYAKYIFPRTYFDQLALFQGILRWGVP
ncbi:hypothetical protein V494_08526 [Pseudogymnoascus sp. VKM F-4513 (FW-928)]|nr:hypothetical protein V494_08526 [Pseudogymnoascus sp. VKM F-4513 (FW-928)]